MSKHLIDLVDIRKTYGEDDALKNINLYIRDGEFLTLLGPSGCGKTTMLRLIAGFTMPTEGKILIDGKDVSAVPPFKRRVNTVFQKYALFPHLNVYDNVAFGLKIQKLSAHEIDTRVDEMLEMIDDAVKKSGIRLGNWSNVYFTGGGLMPMGGARVYAAGKLARNVREAAVKTVKLKPAQIYASGSGLLELVYNTIEQEEQDEGLFDRIKRAFKKR